ncbi:hypothetical protein CHS0354_028457 [Potamilus streckersoni]|uniref:Uncharacterized protein n=1 Tax=Potamilus streckersoni TaxID=2493646 RepID=A0AAE0VTV2_9BIVA|nr:hypothetical protein CHS0354_028457 [Potamilus streckersoni]
MMMDRSEMHSSAGSSQDVDDSLGNIPMIQIESADGHSVVTFSTDNVSVLTINDPDSQAGLDSPRSKMHYLHTGKGDAQSGDCQPLSDSDQTSACLVCGDRGSGYHYSVFSCEGCKGFFKRTVQKNLIYNCKDKGQCMINKFTRNTCQACRFQKCMEMGMKREAVREDRSPGGKHRHKRLRLGEVATEMGSSDCTEPDLTSDYAENHRKLVEELVTAKPFSFPKNDSFPNPASMDPDEIRTLGINELMQFGYMELRLIIDWAKKVPGFRDFCIEDQMALLKSSFMELNVFRLAFRSLPLENAIKFADGLEVPSSMAEGLGWGKELVSATLEFTHRLRDLDLDQPEFSIMNAIVLTYPDAQGVQDKQKILNLQTKFLDVLRRYMRHTYPQDLYRYGKILLRLPSLRTLSAKAAERFLSLTLEGTLQINDLVLEMMN